MWFRKTCEKDGHKIKRRVRFIYTTKNIHWRWRCYSVDLINENGIYGIPLNEVLQSCFEEVKPKEYIDTVNIKMTDIIFTIDDLIGENNG